MTCTKCGVTDNPLYLCDRTEVQLCYGCYSQTACYRGEHGEGAVLDQSALDSCNQMTRAEEIEWAAAGCRLACAALKVGDVAQHVHHGRWLEVLTEPVENRIAFILDNKDPSEVAERLRRMRPFDWEKADAAWKKAYADWEKTDAARKKADADWEKAYAEWKRADASSEMLKLHAQVCGCPWDETHDLFGRER